MPIPTIPLWGQLINNGINNIRNIWKTSKERYNSMTREQKAEAARVGDQWVTDNVLPVVTTVGELIPQTSIPMAAYNASEAAKQGNYEEAFQHVLTPVLTGAVSKGVNLGLKASEKAIDSTGMALKNADNYVTIQNALKTGKLRFGEPTTYTGIHQSKTPLTKVQFPFQRWDVTTHGADPNGFWLTLADSPNTTGTMASRPYASRWIATSQKPLIQTGEVKGILGKKNNTRNAIVKYGKKHGADAFEFRGIRDNAVPQTDVVMITEGTNPQYLGEFTERTYVSPKTSYISIQTEEPIMSGEAHNILQQAQNEINRYFWEKGYTWDEASFEDIPYITDQHYGLSKEIKYEPKNLGYTPNNPTLDIEPLPKNPNVKMSPNEARHETLEKVKKKYGDWLVDKILDKNKK